MEVYYFEEKIENSTTGVVLIQVLFCITTLSLPSSPPQDAFRNNYGWVGDWVQSCGVEFVDALRGLETRGIEVDTSSMKYFRAMLTPASRRLLLQFIMAPESTMAVISTHSQEIQKATWAEWHFKRAPDNLIHPDRSMFLRPSVACVW